MIGIEQPITEKRKQTGPHLYKPEETAQMRRILSTSTALNEGRVFWPGIVEIEQMTGRRHFIWCHQMTDQADGGVSIKKNGDLVLDQDLVVDPSDVRLIKGLQRNFTLRTGHLIPASLEFERFFAIVNFVEGRRITRITHLEILLLQIEAGTRPSNFSRESFIRVSNNFVGKTVTRLDLVSPLDGEINDHVLVRGREIVYGMITHPLTEFAYRQAKAKAG